MIKHIHGARTVAEVQRAQARSQLLDHRLTPGMHHVGTLPYGMESPVGGTGLPLSKTRLRKMILFCSIRPKPSGSPVPAWVRMVIEAAVIHYAAYYITHTKKNHPACLLMCHVSDSEQSHPVELRVTPFVPFHVNLIKPHRLIKITGLRAT
jgi:hypothetical protein